MTGYEKLLMLLRNEGSRYNPPSLLLGEMISTTEISLGRITLDADDYYIAEHLTKPLLTKLNLSSNLADNSTYINPLKEGDIVLLYPLTEEKYVVIERVVEPNVSL